MNAASMEPEVRRVVSERAVARGREQARGRRRARALAGATVLLAILAVTAPASATAANSYGQTFAGQAKCLSCHQYTTGAWQAGTYLQTAHGRFITDVTTNTAGLSPSATSGLWPSGTTGGGLSFAATEVAYIYGQPGGTRDYVSVYRNDGPHTLTNGMVQAQIAGPADDWWTFSPAAFNDATKMWEVTGKTGVRNYFQSCGGCHFLGVTRPATTTYTLPSGATQSRSTETSFSGVGIQCENCHGTGRAQVATEGHQTSGVLIVRTKRVLESQTCGQCHITGTAKQLNYVGGTFSGPNGFTTDRDLSDFYNIGGAEYIATSAASPPASIPTTDTRFWPSGHNKGMNHGAYNEWMLSAHARTLRYAGGDYWTGSPRETCLGCHSGEGFLKRIGYGTQGPNDIGALPSNLASDTLDIECGVCHQVHSRTGDALGLRMEPEQLCGACHSARIAEGAEVAPTAHPRYSAKEMIAGYGLIGVPAAGRFMGEAECPDCHMPETRTGRKSHRFTPMLPGDAASFGVRAGGDSCTPCHPGSTRGELQADIDGWQSAVTARLAQANAAIASAKARPAYAGYPPIRTAVSAAQANVWFVEGDASRGVHNPEYALAGLDRAILFTKAVGCWFEGFGSTPFDAYSGASLVHGRLVLSDGAPGAGLDVSIEARPAGTSAWTRVATVRTDAGGGFATAVHPTGNTDYRARWIPVADADAISPPTRVTFGSSISIRASASRVRVGRYVTLSGSVSPAHAGQVVSIHYRQASRSGYRTLSVRTLSASSTWSVRFRVAGRGYYYFHAHFGGDDSHNGSTSRTASVRGY